MLKKTQIVIVLSIILSSHSFSFSIVRPPSGGNNTETKNPDYMKASVFIKMSAKEFMAATGKKLNLFQKIYFKVIQRQIKRDLKKNPGLLMSDYFDPKKVKFKFDLLWFVIAAIIGPLGVLLAYTHKAQKKEITTRKDKVTSAWLGFLFWILWFGWLFIF